MKFSLKTVLSLLLINVFESDSASKKTKYYKHYTYDASFKLIENNLIVWDGISCFIDQNEKWDYIKVNWKGVALKGYFLDIKGNKDEFVFDNFGHDGFAFKAIIDHLSLLIKYSTHYSVKEILNKNKEIEKKEKVIIELKTKLKAKKHPST